MSTKRRWRSVRGMSPARVASDLGRNIPSKRIHRTVFAVRWTHHGADPWRPKKQLTGLIIEGHHVRSARLQSQGTSPFSTHNGTVGHWGALRGAGSGAGLESGWILLRPSS